MQLTILACPLPQFTPAQYRHEFRDVHAEETKSLAASLGIITRYVQGLVLPLYGPSEEQRTSALVLPLPTPSKSLEFHSFAQLTWPSLTILRESFATEDYRNSAGKHVFAEPVAILRSDQLELGYVTGGAVMLLCVLEPTGHSIEFLEKWDEHAAVWRARGIRYQRNMGRTLTKEEVERTFQGTEFPPATLVHQGGYEQFIFDGYGRAQEFLNTHKDELARSYGNFSGGGSYSVLMDYVTQYDEAKRGVKQVLTGILIGGVLTLKSLFR